MALGTPVAASVNYSGGLTTITPAYPTGITAGDGVIMIIGMKPSTANSGSVTTPTGWTLIDSLTAAGGYGTTLGADTGNTNLWIYAKNTVTGSETGNLTVTIATSNIAWAFMIRVPVGTGTLEYGGADGQRTTAPTAGTPFTVALTNGASPTNFQSGDLAIWAMCIPTDVTTPSQFSAPSITATGATFGTAVKLLEPDSSTGNDIGGYSAYAFCTAGSSSVAPSVTVTPAGTITNVRGPVVLVRLREVIPPAQTLTQNARFNNTNTFYTQTLTKQNTLTPALYTNTNTFYSATVTTTRALAPALYTNTNTFYTPTVTSGAAVLAPNLYTNTNTFYSAAVATSYALAPARYDNTNTFYSATVTPGTATVAPDLYTNTNAFYSPTVIQGAAVQTLLPDLFTNTNTFYAPTAAATYSLYLGPYVDDGYVDPWYIGLSLQNINQFYTPTATPGTVTLTPDLYTNTNVFYAATVESIATVSPDRYDNTNTFYSATVTPGAINLIAPYVENTNTFYDATVDIGPAVIAPARYNNVNAFYSPFVVIIQPLEPDLYVNTNVFPSATVGSRAYVRPARFNNTNEFFSATLIQQQFIYPDLLQNTNRFFRPTVRSRYTLTPARVNNTNDVFGPIVTGLSTLLPALAVNDNTFFTPTVVPPTATLTPALYVNDNEFPDATVTPGAIDLAPTRVDNTNSFYAADVYQFQNIRPPILLNTSSFFPPVVLRGVPVPNWNPVPMANNENYAGVPLVAAPSWAAAGGPPAPNYTPDSQTATPNWNPL